MVVFGLKMSGLQIRLMMGIASLEMGISSWIKKLLPPNLRAEYNGSLLPRLDPAWLDSLPPTNHGWVHSTQFVVLWWYLHISKASKYFFTCWRKEWVNIRVRYVTSQSPILIVTTDQLIIYILITRLSISNSKGSVKLCQVQSVLSFYSGAHFLYCFPFMIACQTPMWLPLYPPHPHITIPEWDSQLPMPSSCFYFLNPHLMCLYPDLAFIWIFHQGYVHQIKNGDILQLGGQCAIGTRQNGGRICWREATQRGQFLLPYQFYQIIII